MSHGKLMFDGTIEELREKFPGGPQSLESMYLAMTETPHDLPVAKLPVPNEP